MPTTSAYPILDPAATVDPYTAVLRSTQCAFVVMAKAPRPGKVKTRLSPPLTLEQAAALNIAFLQDTAQNLAEACGHGLGAGIISYTPIGEEALFDGLLPLGFFLIPQRGESFGERLLNTAEDILACGYGSVCLIDSDSPTVPTAAFKQAIEALNQPGDRIVLGPSHDGGYYLIGLKRAHPEPFTNIAWSTPTVAAQTRDRCHEANLELIELPLWYDVDDAETLATLTNELLEATPPPFATIPGYPAPNTRAFLLDLKQQGSGTNPGTRISIPRHRPSSRSANRLPQAAQQISLAPSPPLANQHRPHPHRHSPDLPLQPTSLRVPPLHHRLLRSLRLVRHPLHRRRLPHPHPARQPLHAPHHPRRSHRLPHQSRSCTSPISPPTSTATSGMASSSTPTSPPTATSPETPR